MKKIIYIFIIAVAVFVFNNSAMSEVSYIDDIQPVFNDHCVACHGSNGGLSLEEEVSYGNLVNVEARGYPGMIRVVPWDSSSSVLYLKVTGDSSVGTQMPVGGELSTNEIDLIRDWIDEGAAGGIADDGNNDDSDDGNPEYYTMPDYYPLKQGNSWTYFGEITPTSGDINIFSENSVISVSETEMIDGVSVNRVGDWKPDGDYLYDLLTWDDDGLKFYGAKKYETENNAAYTEEIHPLYPILLIPNQLKEGERLTEDFALNTYRDGDLNFYAEGNVIISLERFTDVTVDAGTFEDSLMVLVEFTGIMYSYNGGTSLGSYYDHRHFFLSKGIGPVRIHKIKNRYKDGIMTVTTNEYHDARWFTVNGVNAGEGPVNFGNYETFRGTASFQGTTMLINDIYTGAQELDNLAFCLNSESLSYMYIEEDCIVELVEGADFSRAYIKLNGNELEIYDMMIDGVGYRSSWTFRSDGSDKGFFLDSLDID